MTPASRPLRALALTLGGWTTMRVVALWPVGNAAELPLADAAEAPVAPPMVAAPFDTKMPLFPERRVASLRPLVLESRHPELVSGSIRQAEPAVRTRDWMLKQACPEPCRRVQHDGTSDKIDPQPGTTSSTEAIAAIAPGLPAATPHNRFSGSAWSLMRGDGAPSLAAGGQLGGSQIGVRVFYAPGPEALALTARISAPLSQPSGREAAIGIALRGRNIGLIAEQRISLDKGGRDAPAVFAYGGVSDVKLPGGVKLDGYAQAGVVGVKEPAAFVDGAVRFERTVIKAEKASLAVGAGAWGGAQPGASRIDVGPQVVAHITVAETNLRISAEWRERVAGDAAPASGPSVTVGFDF